jgi:hypothetical protein
LVAVLGLSQNLYLKPTAGLSIVADLRHKKDFGYGNHYAKAAPACCKFMFMLFTISIDTDQKKGLLLYFVFQMGSDDHIRDK